jgi:putative SOS response-associated peptidase YedK
VLADGDTDRWLDSAFSDTERLAELLVPFDPAALEAWPVSRQVNAPRNEGPALVEPAA